MRATGAMCPPFLSQSWVITPDWAGRIGFSRFPSMSSSPRFKPVAAALFCRRPPRHVRVPALTCQPCVFHVTCVLLARPLAAAHVRVLQERTDCRLRHQSTSRLFSSRRSRQREYAGCTAAVRPRSCRACSPSAVPRLRTQRARVRNPLSVTRHSTLAGGMTTARAAPSNAVLFMAYELTMRLLRGQPLLGAS